MTAPPRRTQAQRRAAAITKLVEATIEAIAEVGYHNASLGEISRRAGVSKGGIFRHFDSRTDLVVAAAEEVGRRHMRAFDNIRVRENTDRPLDLTHILHRARNQIRQETNTVWFELLVAARTEPQLRARLAPVASALIDDVERVAVAALSPAVPADIARLLATSIVHMFDGEAIFRSTYPRPELEDTRIEYIAGTFQRLAAQSRVESDS
ncbi:TetR/AcrR family transcriptional regulator [Nocardia ninae]|uniref:TetR family transcriptional regulator n=1 Tax=Nocardia ninae NBRC 108245 TaxID=1210091 RepID=A0A511M873_9NOCA|nr:TetR/AcrR family transcriptional regulator [Nocardia ninae]GEM36799.1 TetR family transcriptional regulator [Nocardia ninae NBRC 108245]